MWWVAGVLVAYVVLVLLWWAIIVGGTRGRDDD